jgi:hypothetical protein
MAVCPLKGDCTLAGRQFFSVHDRHPTVPLYVDTLGVRPLDLGGPVTSIAGLDASMAQRLLYA